MLDQIIRVNKINLDEIKSIQGDQSVDWLSKILDELMEDLQGQESTKSLISLNGELEVREDSIYRKVLLLEGTVNVTYSDICSKSGDIIDQSLNIALKSIFLEKSMNNQHELEDEISLFYDEEEWDLYFYEKNQVDLYPIIHEYIFLNKNPYPGQNDE